MDNEYYESTKLSYKIHKYSSYSGNFKPENIMVKRPGDQLSRWFTDSTTPSQFVMLKLDTPSIVETITFGKYIKSHVSDLKKFQIFGGMEENNLSLLLTSGLKKDNISETFRLRRKTSEGLKMPIYYLKIVPIQSWGPAYNYTIWYVELKGDNRENIVKPEIDIINMRKEEEAVRIILKHLRRRRYKDAFEALSRESGVQLEGPLQTRLWNALVEDGDFKAAEEIFEEAVENKEIEWYMSWQAYTPEWRALAACSDAVEDRLCFSGAELSLRPRIPPISCADRDLVEGTEEDFLVPGEEDGCECPTRPGPRGGHQLVVDPTTGTLYLFGGWNGVKDLDDLWTFDTSSGKWRLLCRSSKAVGGPFPRSCHKMVFDPHSRKLFTLGRYLDNSQRTPENMLSDMYSFDVVSESWSLVCANTAAVGGPRLMFDHQMCVDERDHNIYVFGGRVLPNNSDELYNPQYSGLYAYNIPSDTWRLLLDDRHELCAPLSRVSHSMLFHPKQRRLYIFAGQRNRQQLVDMWWWDVDSDRCGLMCHAEPRAPPALGFTQRATLDPDSGEIYVLSGMSKINDKKVNNTLWVFSISQMTWSCVYRNDCVSPAEPRPRFAHQFVYDPVKKVHYLFGGNPGSLGGTKVRLDDLWALRLHRPRTERVLQTARAALREACYREQAADPSRALPALHYLRSRMRAVTDLANPAQVAKFHQLALLLMSGSTSLAGPSAPRPLCPRRTRALLHARAAVRPQDDLAIHLAQVLGVEEASMEAPYPLEPVAESPGCEEEVTEDGEWDVRAARVRLYEMLCTYFRPSVAPPRADLADLVRL